MFGRMRKAGANCYWWLRRRAIAPVVEAAIIYAFRIYLAIKAGSGRRARCVLINGDRIGPLAERADAALRFKARSGGTDEVWFGVVQEICNPPLGRIINQQLPLIVSPLVYWSMANSRSRSGKTAPFAFERPLAEYSDFYEESSSFLALPDADKKYAERKLHKRYGLNPDDWFVAFHARDEAYLNGSRNARDWAYHGYRNSRIEDCRDLADMVGNMGGKAVRIGATVESALSQDWGPNTIDYAAGEHDPTLDLYLLSQCRFAAVGGGSGIGFTAQAFGRPVIWTNFIPAYPWPWCADDLFVPKLLRRRITGKLLTFAELRDLGFFLPSAPLATTSFYEENGLEVVDNSPEEIAGAAREMMARLNGEAMAPELIELQQEFRRQFKPNRPNGGNISADFLARHRNLL